MHNVKVRMVGGKNTSIHQLIRKILNLKKKKHSQPNKIVSLLERKYVMHGMVILCCVYECVTSFYDIYTNTTHTTVLSDNDSFSLRCGSIVAMKFMGKML